MTKYKLIFAKQAAKDIQTLNKKQKNKLKKLLLEVIAINPFEGKKLLGNLRGNYSYRLNLKDRIVYSIDKKSATVFVKRVRTHYGE